MDSIFIYFTFNLISLSRKLKSLFLLSIQNNFGCLKGKKCTLFSIQQFLSREGNELVFAIHILFNLFGCYFFGGRGNEVIFKLQSLRQDLSPFSSTFNKKSQINLITRETQYFKFKNTEKFY